LRDAGAGDGIAGRLAELTIVAETREAITARLSVALGGEPA
jgi:hypothetical protein